MSDIPTGNGGGNFRNMSLPRMLKYSSLFLKYIFTGDLQLFVITEITLISI